jgi:glycosyltransferase involved in cell wall biosynthesis
VTRRTRLVVAGPLPPPFHGVTVSTSLVLANPLLHERFDVAHLDTSDPRDGTNIATWDVTNVRLALGAIGRLARLLDGSRGLLYLPLSQSTPGFLRDSLLLHAASLRGWRTAVHLRGSDFRDFYETASAPERAWIRSTLARVDTIAVLGESLRRVFDGLTPPSRLAVVPNGTPEPDLDGVRRDPNHVLYLGNLRRRKGIVETVEAALLVLGRRPAARFSFVGAWEDAALRRQLLSRTAPAGGAIAFREPVRGRAKDRLLGSAAVLVFAPARPEGHPRVVLEALAAGTPVVATNRGAIAETVEDGRCGYVLPHPEPTLIAERTLRLLADDALRQRMGLEARARYLSRFTQHHADRALADWLALAAVPLGTREHA